MTDLTVKFASVSVPSGTSGTVYLYENTPNQTATTDRYGRSYNNVNSTSLVDGQTSYTLSGYDGSSDNKVWVNLELDGSVTATPEVGEITGVSLLSPPSNLTITDDTTEGELTLDWDTVSGAAGYHVYRAQSSGSTTADYTQVADVAGPPHTDTGVGDGERYFYVVSATDGSTESDLSSEVAATTPLPAPSGLTLDTQ